MPSNGLVEANDGTVVTGVERTKEGLDVFSVHPKLGASVGECVDNRIRCEIKGMVPLEPGGNGLRSASGTAR